MGRNTLIDIACEVLIETDKGYQITDDGETKVWVPKSQVEWHPDGPNKDTGTMVMPEWLAQEKGLI